MHVPSPDLSGQMSTQCGKRLAISRYCMPWHAKVAERRTRGKGKRERMEWQSDVSMKRTVTYLRLCTRRWQWMW